ncbi:MAG: hypothetical protein COA96_10255 [SAR86 cluster bacterium]|uniref:Uncharacterized protein n=1 Tax=SAR86 cluster bacterium TaxID=2030880 RepID=A0A2A5AZA0_9GAMM|nr:MAG: hypothetical protein COA96_10255 [SAR86 cluster bacterium]
MTDLSDTIIAKSDQTNAIDLIAGPKTIKVAEVHVKKGDDQPTTIKFEGDNGHPYKPSKGMRRVLCAAWGKESSAYPGRSMTLFNNPDVTWAGKKVGGIQISHLSNIDGPITVPLIITRGNSKPFTVQPLQVQDTASTQDKPEDHDTALKLAKAAANEGTEAFKEWWNSDEGKTIRKLVKDDMPELQEICKTADIVVESDPFGAPPIEEGEGAS